MKISEFVLQKALLEIRYDPAYPIWDRAGSLWHTAAKKWPGLQNTKAEPNSTAFKWKNRYELAALLERAYVSSIYPQEFLDEFYEVIDGFVGFVVDTLEIEKFNRIGFRIGFIKKYESREEAIASFTDLSLLSVPEGKQFGIDGPIVSPSYQIGWEGDELGVTVRVNVVTEKVDFDVPPGVRDIKSIHYEDYALIYDVDYHTLAPTSVGQLKPLGWAKSIMQVVRRDAAEYLGG